MYKTLYKSGINHENLKKKTNAFCKKFYVIFISYTFKIIFIGNNIIKNNTGIKKLYIYIKTDHCALSRIKQHKTCTT